MVGRLGNVVDAAGLQPGQALDRLRARLHWIRRKANSKATPSHVPENRSRARPYQRIQAQTDHALRDLSVLARDVNVLDEIARLAKHRQLTLPLDHNVLVLLRSTGRDV